MKKYIDLSPFDIVKSGDQFSPNGVDWENAGNSLGCKVSQFSWLKFRRPLSQHNWISFKDRYPTEQDAFGSKAKLDKMNLEGRVLVMQSDGNVYPAIWQNAIHYGPKEATHWMPLNFVEDEPEPVKVDGKSLLPQKNGDIKLSCGTVIPSKDFEKVARQRAEAMKA